VAAWEAPESVIQQGLIGLRADGCTDENPSRIEIGSIATGNGITLDTLKAHIWLATIQHVWACPAEEVLHALSNEEGECITEAEAHPAGYSELLIPNLEKKGKA
jgi:hypothetical protein